MKIAIIGSGMVGSSVAYECAKAGAKVMVFDSGRLCGGTSSTSFAWTNATSKNPQSYYALNVEGMRAHHELRRDFGTTPWLHQTGSLEWRTTAEGRNLQLANYEQMHSRGYGCTWIDVDRLAIMEPDINIDAIGDAPVVYYPEEGYVYTVPYATTLLRAARDRFGATLSPHTSIRTIETRNNRTVAVVTGDGARIDADIVVNCTGARSDVELGVPALPMNSGPGLLAYTNPVPVTLRSQFHIDDLDVRPDGAGRLVIHKASVDNQLTSTETLSVDGPEAAELFEITRGALPALEGCHIEALRLTTRPVPKDGFPCIGAMPGMDGYYVATTHSGVTLSPYIGRALADEIVRQKPHATIAPFTPDRFFSEQGPESVSAELVGQTPVKGPA